jgi:AraC-like DNA-binding protein
LLGVFAGDAARPSTIRLPHPAPDASFAAYRDVFGCPVVFNADRLAIEFDAKQAASHVPGSNPDLAAVADRLAERYLAQVEPDSAAARVRALLLQAMPSGKVEQDRVARALHQSASTLQRRLRDEGTTYQRLLDATRKDLALEYLREGRHNLADITFLLGFADQSNFTRAFRRWTGKTPRQFLS